MAFDVGMAFDDGNNLSGGGIDGGLGAGGGGGVGGKLYPPTSPCADEGAASAEGPAWEAASAKEPACIMSKPRLRMFSKFVGYDNEM